MKRPALQKEPIAIIGIGCRLPGQASSTSKLWDLLANGKSGHCKVPSSRYTTEAFHHPDAERPGSINSTGGYFIQEDIRTFENAFFKINNLEATYMDPQQRKLLEVVYESFENAGAPLEKINGSNTGVYVGNFTLDFMVMQYQDPEYFSRYSATGAGLTVLSNRITHCFDLHGPSVVLDTACSSSLYALHSACLALDGHDCDAAIVASANLIQSPEQQLIAVKAGILSPDSICHTFDDSANGYGRAEGVASLYLKRLSDALRDGDPIRSVIRGTAVNGNGRTPGIVQPSVSGQEEVIRHAYLRAGLPLDETDYIEAHGTGTKVGDPTEVEAISRAFKHKSGRPTLIGGIKPNLGHSEGASGITSVIKAVLALENRVIPPTVGVSEVNPSIKTHDWNVEIAVSLSTWPKSVIPRAGVNSFGFGGANSHAVLEAGDLHLVRQNGDLSAQPNGETTSCHSQNEETRFLLAFSAETSYSLTQMVNNIASYTSRQQHPFRLMNLAYTLACRRSRLGTRGYLLASESSMNNDIQSSQLVLDKSNTSGHHCPFVFVFTGQGAQWPGMGRQLFYRYPIFCESIRHLDKCLKTLAKDISPEWTIEETLLGLVEPDDINLASKSQTACTAVQIALTNMFCHWGIMPRKVVGHSSGEIGAAYAAGHITAYQAIVIAFCRGLIVSRSSSRGAMVAVGMEPQKAQEFVVDSGLQDTSCIACFNSPESCTLSGDEEVISRLHDEFQEKRIFSRKLKTDGKAYHSHHMKAVSASYQTMLETIWDKPSCCMRELVNSASSKCSSSSVQMLSTVTGTQIDSVDVSSPVYWRKNLESPVRFDMAISAVLEEEQCDFIEIGPHPALELPTKQTAQKAAGAQNDFRYNTSLVRGQDSVTNLLNLMGTLFLQGHDEVSLEKVNEDGQNSTPKSWKLLIDLPTYPWDYCTPLLWNEPRSVTEFRQRQYPRHDLLGSRVPGGSKITITWRNILDIDEISWLKDHCLGPSIVFPAAAYLAMAVEAVCQAHGLQLNQCPGVQIRTFNFLQALDFHPELKTKTELFTEMRPAQISNTSLSKRWWEFSVASVAKDDANPTLHAKGLVSLASELNANVDRRILLQKADMEEQAIRVWYDKFTKEGLNWGPQFAVMERVLCDRARKAQQASATTHLIRGDYNSVTDQPQYVVHPVSIDSMLQTAFVATTAGVVRNLRATVPVSLDSVEIAAPAALNMEKTEEWTINAVSESVGFGTVKINAELHNHSDQVLVRMSNVRCIAYQGNVQSEMPTMRNPMARVVWKPVALGNDKDFTNYLDTFTENCKARGINADGFTLRLAGALDLVAHENPDIRILELGGHGNGTLVFMDILRSKSPLRRFHSYFKATLSEKGEIRGSQLLRDGLTPDKADRGRDKIIKDEKFDLIIILEPHKIPLTHLDNLLSSSWKILTSYGAALIPHFASLDAVVVKDEGDATSSVALVGSAPWRQTEEPAKQHSIIIVNRGSRSSALDLKMQSALEKHFGHTVPIVALAQVRTTPSLARSIILSTIEAEQSLLRSMSEDEMASVRTMTNEVSKILWITNANHLDGRKPDFALVLGLSRAVMLEQPSVGFAIFDVDNLSSNLENTIQNIQGALEQLIKAASPELEFVQRNDVVHISRWEPEAVLNDQFRLKQKGGTVDKVIDDVGRCTLNIDQPGQLDTIRFVHNHFEDKIRPREVEVQVKSIGLNAKDLYVLGAKVDTKNASCSCECAGMVTATAPDVTDLKRGDRVVAMAPGHFATYERIPRWAVCKLRDDEEYNVASTIPIVFSTTIYALQYRAELQPGESVLIHSAAGGVGLAAIQVAKQIGAKIFATVGTESKKAFLADTFGLNPDHIFSSRDSSFLPAVLSNTSGKGVDVVLNSLTGDLLHDSFQACADFGRFIEIGKRDISEHGKLDMATFGRNVSFIAFDLSNLYTSAKPAHHDLWQRLLTDSMDLIRAGKAEPCSPLKLFDASEITQAFRHFSLGTRIGKVSVSFENEKTLLKVVPSKYETTFSPKKSYLMVGCLGGLGRSLSKWMMARGARSFIFLARSGVEKPAARDLVQDLQKQGAIVEVVRGNVAIYEDVESAIQASKLPIGGVVQAAMSLNEALWTAMSNEQWHNGIRPKVQGTWNLHNALRQRGRDSQLDFFLMTSSISGTVGTATESNYCAGNAFLDSFARFRRDLGLPAISVGLGMISEVGYLHEHPDIEALMKRKGIYAINEDELLQIVDFALVNQDTSPETLHYDALVTSHLLTGIEFVNLKEQRDCGFEGDNHVLTDPRAALFAAAFSRSTRQDKAVNGSVPGASGGESLPEQVKEAMRSGEDAATVLDAVRTLVAKKISNLILLPPEDLKPEQELGQFGLDSMLATEFRRFVFQTLEVDVPFMMLLAKKTSVNDLAELIVKDLEERLAK